MTAIWTLQEIMTVLGVDARLDVSQRVTGISIDTRTLKPGDMFVALQGDNNDGHSYVEQALNKGAVGALVSRTQGLNGEIIVGDTLQALQKLAIAARERVMVQAERVRIIGVTGSVGKTGTRAMLDLALQAQKAGEVYASIKSYNNHWGVPLCLAKMPETTGFGVFEIGMSNAGEIRPLAKMVQPDIALITTIQAQHIENFDGIEGIAQAKAEIFEGVVQGGVVVLPRDNDHYLFLKELAEAAGVQDSISFGQHQDADICICDLQIDVSGSRATVDVSGKSVEVYLPVMGAHLLHNACGVLACIHAADLDVAKAAQGLQNYQNPDGRGGLFWINGSQDNAKAIGILDDSYNAAPVAMVAGLNVLDGLANASGRRKIAVMGDIYELGKREDEVIEMLVTHLRRIEVDQVHGCGPMMARLLKQLPSKMQGIAYDDHEVFATALETQVAEGDLVFIKGSRGPGQKPRMQVVMEKLCDALRLRVNSAN